MKKKPFFFILSMAVIIGAEQPAAPVEPFAGGRVSDYLAQQYQHPLLQKKISLHLGSMQLSALIVRIAAFAGLSVVMDEPLKQTVPLVHAHKQPVGQLLHSVLAGRQQPLAILVVGTVLHVARRSIIQRRAKMLLTGVSLPCKTAVVTIVNAPWDEVLKLRLEAMWHHCINQHRSAARLQHFFIDDAGRRVLIQGCPQQIMQFKKLVAAIDTSVPQVSLQARVVITRASVISRMGLTAQVAYNRQAAKGTGFGFVGIGDVSSVHIPYALKGMPGDDGPGLSLPFVFGGSDLATRCLNVALNAAERRQDLKTLLAPQLVSVSERQAQLLEGQRVPIESMVEEAKEGRVRNVRSVEYKEVGVQLKVKPRVLPDNNRIHLDLLVEHSQVAAASTNSIYPTLRTSRIKNQVILRSGQTVLLGGLVRTTNEKKRRGVPFLSQLPLLGLLFSGQDAYQEEQRLYVFLTAKVVSTE